MDKRPKTLRENPINILFYVFVMRRISQITTVTAAATFLAFAIMSSTTITPALAQPSYTQLIKATAATTPGSVHLSVTTAGNIPRFPDSFIQSVLVFGYAWLNNGQGLVAVIHPGFKDSFQNPSEWHTHTVVLSGACIKQLGTSQAGITITMTNNALGVNTGIAQAGSSIPNGSASFIVQKDPACTDTGLGVQVLSQVAITH